MASGSKVTSGSEAAFTADHPSVQPFRISPAAFLARHFPPPAGSSAAAATSVGSSARPAPPAFIATGAIVFDRRLPTAAAASPPPLLPPPRVLLLRRAAHDSMPLRWESSGGGCDAADAAVLAACARELREEAGLRAVTVGPLVRCPSSSSAAGATDGVGESGGSSQEAGQADWGERMGGHFFSTRRGRLVCKFYFVVEVEKEEGEGQERPAVALDPNEHAGFVWATEQEVRNEVVQKGEGGGAVQLEFTTPEQKAVLLEAFKLWRSGVDEL